MGMTSAERNDAIDKFDTLMDLINQKKIDYSRNALEKDLKAFKLKSWFDCNKILTILVILILAPFTAGISLVVSIVMLILISKAETGYQNYLKLVNQLKSNSLVKSTFNGDRSLSNDSYKLYLAKHYNIDKNATLDKFVCNDKLFNNVDDALTYADSLEQALTQSLKSTTSNKVSESSSQVSENHNSSKSILSQQANNPESSQEKNSVNKPIIIVSAVLIFGIGTFFFFKSNNYTINPNKPYNELRNEILSSGWKVYKRTNEIKGWTNKPYPEIDTCDEDYCIASFISSDGNKVREVGFGYCSTDRYIRCPNKLNGFEIVQRDVVISKSKSDSNFLENKRRAEH